MALLLATSDGRVHRYAGSHSETGLLNWIRSADNSGWLTVIDDAGRTAHVQTSQIVAITELDADGLSYESV